MLEVWFLVGAETILLGIDMSSTETVLVLEVSLAKTVLLALVMTSMSLCSIIAEYVGQNVTSMGKFVRGLVVEPAEI